MMTIVTHLSERVGMVKACALLYMSRSRLYRRRHPRLEAKPRRVRSHALTLSERELVRATLNSERFMDQSPRQVYAALLDDGQYLCHWRTMYRVLAVYAEVRERRHLRRHPVYQKPELLATAPNQVWSWDITALRGPRKWTSFPLYVVLDIYSRCVVGWMIAEAETSELAGQLIAASAHKQGIQPDQLILHADNGAPMRGKALSQLLVDLGILKSHSRPHTSDDNPFSEAQFKTLKYRPDFPARFADIEAARTWARRFFRWYNDEHYHSGLNLLTPASVHEGTAVLIQQQRQAVMTTAYAAHPARFRRGHPQVEGAPTAVWINPPQSRENLS